MDTIERREKIANQVVALTYLCLPCKLNGNFEDHHSEEELQELEENDLCIYNHLLFEVSKLLIFSLINKFNTNEIELREIIENDGYFKLTKSGKYYVFRRSYRNDFDEDEDEDMD